MKIKSIAAICKKNKNIAIFERYSDDGDILTQYIGDGSAVYPVIGLPPLDAISIHALLAESDTRRDGSTQRPLKFLSTLSLRRATTSAALTQP